MAGYDRSVLIRLLLALLGEDFFLRRRAHSEQTVDQILASMGTETLVLMAANYLGDGWALAYAEHGGV